MALTRQLYPTGYAFKMADNSYLEALHYGLLTSEIQAYEDAVSIFDSLLPDNNNFTTDDATDWERRLGLTYNPLATLADRKAAIIRKFRTPGVNPAKGHYLNLERELRLAGFDVYVYENIFPDYPTGYITQNPAVLNPAILSQAQHGDFQHGDVQSNYLNNICVNHIDLTRDVVFNIGTSLKSTFFIGGDPLGSYASVPLVRKNEFRQLILRIKQVQTVGILFINYT